MENKKLSYRLGIDLGATSLGWCMLGLSKENEVMGIIDMGVRIFHDGREAKTETPLSVARGHTGGSVVIWIDIWRELGILLSI
ncbi:MAG: hypothetical protein GX294_04120 [Candidatus Cloacimonetes bacterium]|nr:hypothetical protein [Candidatus Cloacimonadota bacterium]